MQKKIIKTIEKKYQFHSNTIYCGVCFEDIDNSTESSIQCIQCNYWFHKCMC